jgi:hypothetical protein
MEVPLLFPILVVSCKHLKRSEQQCKISRISKDAADLHGRFAFRPGANVDSLCEGPAPCQSGSMGVRSHEKMETKQKMAIAGSGLVMPGIGLGIVGAALIVPAVFAWTARLVEKGADGLAARVEGASKTVGTVAGNLHRSFNEAKRAGLAEMKRSRSN